MIKRICLVAVLAFQSYLIFSQIIEKKVNIYVGFCQGSFVGEKTCREEGYISPALFPNFGNLHGISAKAFIKSGKIFNLGIDLSYLNATGWENGSSTLYKNSVVKQYSFAPTIQFHKRFGGTGIMNRFKIYAELAPNIGYSELFLSDRLFDIHGQSGTVLPPLNSGDIFWGVKENLGAEVSVTRTFGIFISHSLQQNWIKSKLYNDTGFLCSNINIGLVIRLEKDKYYYY